MKNRTLTLTNKCLMPNYGNIGLEIISGSGVNVWIRDPEGKKKKCIDFLCGLGVTSLGHSHPAVIKAIERQSRKLMHVSNLYATEPMAKLAELLTQATGYANANVFFCNSGAEANEAAGKLARIWAHQRFSPRKNKIISLHNSFHGRTFLSISMTGQAKMQEMFAPGVPGIEFVELNNIDSLRAAANEDVCAVIFETIQAEGGVNLMTKEFYRELQHLSEKFKFLRIVDEVQTGVGRTGKMFSFMHLEDNPENGPEIITLAKALGGGLPIGAVIAKGYVGENLLPGSHATTFGGNPVVCAAALAVLKIIDNENLRNHVNILGDYFLGRLYAMSRSYTKIIKDVRGRGFMIGIELHRGYSVTEAVEEMRSKGILIGTAGSQVIRFLPPLIAQKEHINKALRCLESVLKNL